MDKIWENENNNRRDSLYSGREDDSYHEGVATCPSCNATHLLITATTERKRLFIQELNPSLIVDFSSEKLVMS